MQRFKKLYVLLLILALVGGATALLTRWEQKQEDIRTSGEVILALEPSELQSLAWSYEEQSFSFRRDENGHWLYEPDEAFPVNDVAIEELLSVFESFAAALIIDSPESLADYGLSSPLCSIELATADESYTVTLGDFSELDAQRYASVGDGNVYLVTQDPMESYELVLSDLIEHDEIPSYDRIERIAFSGAQAYSIFYEEDSAHSADPEDLYFTEQDGAVLPLDSYRVEDYLGQVNILSLTKYVSYNASDEELEAYGLNEPELSVAVDYANLAEGEDGNETQTNASCVLHLSRSAEERAASAATDEESGEAEAEAETETEDYVAYARVGESSIVYEISASQFENLMAASYDDLRHRELFAADFAQATEIEISLDGELYTLTTRAPSAAEAEAGAQSETAEESAEEDETLWYYEGEEREIADIQSNLEAIAAESFSDAQPVGKEEISLRIELANENFPSMELTLYRHDGDHCLARRDGESFALVPREEVVALIEAVNRLILG